MQRVGNFPCGFRVAAHAQAFDFQSISRAAALYLQAAFIQQSSTRGSPADVSVSVLRFGASTSRLPRRGQKRFDGLIGNVVNHVAHIAQRVGGFDRVAARRSASATFCPNYQSLSAADPVLAIV